MDSKSKRIILSIFSTLSFGALITTASANSIDLQKKLIASAVGEPALERQVTRMFSSIEQGQLDQVIQSTVQQFFQISPRGELSKEAIELWEKRTIAMARAGLLSRYLAYDLDGNGAISKGEMEGLSGNDAATVFTLLGTSDQNGDGAISAEELRKTASDQAQQTRSRRQVINLMAFDLDENGVVVVDEILKGLQLLADEFPTETENRRDANTTAGSFVKPSEQPEATVENRTNAEGLPVELHMVGIYEPRTTRDQNGLSQTEGVSVKVDRPGVSVALVLGSYEPTRWAIETSAGTRVDEIIVTSRNRVRGDVILNGKQVSVTYRDLPVAYQSRGNRFQPFHKAASRAARVRNAASFHGSYKAPKDGFVIDEAPNIPTREEVEAAVLAQALPASELPDTLRNAFEGKTKSPGSKWVLRDEGFVGVDGNGKSILHKVPLEAPRVSWAMGTAHDPAGQQIWGVTLGGEGYLYRYDIAKNQWSARSMNNVDVGGLIFDPGSGNLITTPGPNGRSGYLTLDASGKVLSKLDIALDKYPGLIGTFDPGNGPGPRMVPVMIDGDLLLVRAESRRGSQRNNLSRWVYLVDLQSGSVRLVR